MNGGDAGASSVSLDESGHVRACRFFLVVACFWVWQGMWRIPDEEES